MWRGWPVALAVAVTVTLTYGVVVSSFTLFIEPLQREYGWSSTAITGAFTVALLVSAAAAAPAGWLLDTAGARPVLICGTLLTGVLVALFAGVRTLPGLYGIWIGLGVTMALALYESAFALIAQSLGEVRMRAIALVTLIGGLATAAVVPLTAALIAADGWRSALAWLAGAEILCGLALVPLLPARGRRTRVAPGNAAVVARASLVPLGIAYAASALVFAVATVHLVPYLIAEGFDAMGAARIVAAAGVSSLLGRALLLRFGDAAVANGVLAAVLLAQALGLALIGLSTSDIALAAYVLLFGIGMGTITPLRAVLVGRMTSGSRYARSNGGLAGVASLSRSAGPVAGSMIAATAAGYRGLFLVCAALLLLGAGALHLSPIVRVSTHET